MRARSTPFGRLILLIAVLASGISFIPTARAQEPAQADLRQFGLLTDSSGWILLGQQIFWTSDAGQTWEDISPALPPGAVTQNVSFLDLDDGWVLFTTLDSEGGALFHLAHTTDRGATWTTRALSFFESGEAGAFAERSDMGWLDAQHGWISVKQASGSNFSLGALFVTSDGGATWTRSALPVADRVTFSDSHIGWAVGGPTGGQVFRTDDAGAHWRDVSPVEVHAAARTTAYPPFVSGRGSLLVTTTIGAENSLGAYSWDNASSGWHSLGREPLEVQPGRVGLSLLGARDFVAVIPGTDSIIRMANGRLDVLRNEDGLSASIVALEMLSMDAGWGKSVESSCVTASSTTDSSVSVHCSSTTRLLHTTDGGRTWQETTLPPAGTGDARAGILSATSGRAVTMNSLSDLGNTQILIGQGFDACEIPTLSQMQTWAGASPYKAVNLYIGGSSRACDNLALNSAFVKQLFQQGWRFIPTWVGPQAPCTGYLTRMSSNPATAYNQGVAQANLAVDALAALGLTLPDQTGSVVYYDIEYYGTDSACRSAVNSFMNGWVSQVHARGNLAGVYASPACNTGLNDFRALANVPDVVWIAAWYHNLGYGFYDPTASVWDYLGACLPASAWANHQRIRQYEGDHNETWGGLTLEVDSNVLDGVVAMAYAPKPPSYIVPTPFFSIARPVMRSKALTVASLVTQSGTTNGSVPSLGLLDQTGAEDNPAAYVAFQASSAVYVGYGSFSLPEDALANSVSTMLLQVNFKGPGSEAQVWTWSMYDWNTNLWIRVGDSIGTTPGQWNTLVFRVRNVQRYVSSGGEMRVQLMSSNANGEAKVDYEALHITYLSVPATPTPYIPPVTPRRPGLFSVPVTPRP